MKKLITALLVIFLLSSSITANSAELRNVNESYPTLAVLDTALDTSIPLIKDRLIGEVCILDWSSCPNGTNFMEGPGASVLPMNILSNVNFSHGTQMVSAAIKNNADIKILFVRIIGNTESGSRQPTSINTVPNALKWIYENKHRYNIKAIAMSQGHHNLLKNKNYCPVTETDYWVDTLSASGIPVFFPAGNGRDYSKIDWPACISNSIAIGGAQNFGLSGFYVSSTSNYDANLIDYWAPISSKVILPGGKYRNSFGTSVAVQIAAAKWMYISSMRPELTKYQILNLIRTTSTPIYNPTTKLSGILINTSKAVNSN